MTNRKELIDGMIATGRSSAIAEFDDPVLGPLRLLPGVWKNTEPLKGFGFNLMALPFVGGSNGFKILMNQYDEDLTFSVADKGVPNRGLTRDPTTGSPDQTIVALDYFQKITQIDSGEFAESGLHQRFDGQRIHKEPGLWLHMVDHNTDDINIARLGTIPHGNSFLAVGRAPNRKENEEDEDNFGLLENPNDEQLEQLPNALIPDINGVVVGGGENPDEIDLEPILDPNTGEVLIDYFEPYRHFHENPYKGKIPIAGFGGFDPVHSTELLRLALKEVLIPIGRIKRVFRLRVDSTLDHAAVNRFTHTGIINTPFVVRQADAAAMNSTFLIYEIEDSETGQNRYFLQYAQNVILDFIGRPDGHPGRARWPHVSINTMERVSDVIPEALIDSIL
ncbi:MAG: heme-binding protein [Paracoccaceae bacterium]